MRFSLGYLREVLPRENPPPEFIPSEVLRAIEISDDFAGGEDREVLQRSTRWTYAMFNEFREGYVDFSPGFDRPPFWRWRSWPPWHYGRIRSLGPELSIGALDQEFEQSGFGLILLDSTLPKSEVIGEVLFPRLKHVFPFVARALSEDFHSAPNLPTATGTCWASENQPPTRWGFLTCRHAFSGVQVGATFSLQGGGTATLVRKAPVTIDAAFAETARPSLATSGLRLMTFPTAGLAVDVHAMGGTQSRSVVSVTDTLGVINDPHFPITVFIDQPCLPGDSGALVQGSAGSGVAIYCGEMKNATVSGQTGQTVGYAQHLEQAVTILDLSPHL